MIWWNQGIPQKRGFPERRVANHMAMQIRNRLLMVEGIPGSGKTTLSERLVKHIQDQGIRARLHREWEPHPADMAWNARLTDAEYQSLLAAHPALADAMRAHATKDGDHVLVAYTRFDLGTAGEALYPFFEGHEVYDGRVDTETFCRLHRERWNRFAADVADDEVVIFECAFLQNHVTELMGYHAQEQAAIVAHLNTLLEPVRALHPKLLYLHQSDLAETIRRVAAERVYPEPGKWPDWIDQVISYVERCPFGRANDLKGYAGALSFFETRRKLELRIMPELDLEWEIVGNDRYDWEAVFADLVSAVDA